MSERNTIYIAEPIYSEIILKYDQSLLFPPIKKIGITSNHPKKREKELLGTLSPVKISIIKAWTDIDAKAVESMLHNILDNTRLDGEYFWDGNETLVDSVSVFIATYYPKAKEIVIADGSDVKAASEANKINRYHRIYTEVVPELEKLEIEYRISKNESDVIIHINNYRLKIEGRTNGLYTLTVWSDQKSTEDALNDFMGSQELSPHSSEESSRRARIPMAKLETIINSLKQYLEKEHLVDRNN